MRTWLCARVCAFINTYTVPNKRREDRPGCISVYVLNDRQTYTERHYFSVVSVEDSTMVSDNKLLFLVRALCAYCKMLFNCFARVH